METKLQNSLSVDLTTKNGVQLAKSIFLNSETSAIIKFGLELLFKILEKFESNSRENMKVQGKLVEGVIQKGKESCVDTMEIKMNNMKGFKLHLPIDKDIKVDTQLGVDNTITINVKYSQNLS